MYVFNYVQYFTLLIKLAIPFLTTLFIVIIIFISFHNSKFFETQVSAKKYWQNYYQKYYTNLVHLVIVTW